jgi:hypothetical protein
MANGNNLELNKGDQFIIALDVSGSMGTTDCPNNTSRISYTLETLKTFVREAAKWDPDGVSFYLFGVKVTAFPDMQPADIDAKLSNFKLEGMTMTHLAIAAAYQEHKTKKNEQTFLMVFTDGQPSDQEAVKQSIINITNDVKDEKEFRITFLTVGNRDAALEAFLTGLDDDLKGAKFDIVDVKKMEDVDFNAAIDGAIND